MRFNALQLRNPPFLAHQKSTKKHIKQKTKQQQLKKIQDTQNWIKYKPANIWRLKTKKQNKQIPEVQMQKLKREMSKN